MVSDPAMLSKPRLESSAGSRVAGSTSQVEEVADDVGVLRPVQAVEHLGAGIQRRRGVDLGFQPVPEGGVVRLGRAPHAGRGHHAGAQLAHHLLPQLGIFTHRVEIATLEREVGGAVAVVVAGQAVALDELAVLGRGGGRPALLRSRRGGGPRGAEARQHRRETDDYQSMQHRRLQARPSGYPQRTRPRRTGRTHPLCRTPTLPDNYAPARFSTKRLVRVNSRHRRFRSDSITRSRASGESEAGDTGTRRPAVEWTHGRL